MPPSTVCTAKASYKKAPGLLELTDTHLQWSQDGKKAPSIRVPYAELASLFCSKEGAAQVRLKVGLVSDDAGHNFTFTSPQPVALSERETFKRELTNIIARNRSTAEPTTPKPVIATSPITPVSNGHPPPLRPSGAATPALPPPISRAASVVSSGGTPGPGGAVSASDFKLRKKVLVNNPELATLHRELVMTGQITEAEFWEGREHLLAAQAAADSQKRGRPGALVDPRPQTVEGGDIKIVITPQLVHDIFEEFPIVAKAYNENVPKPLNEADFWKRYFQSKLFHAHRASIRSSATQNVVKDDPIFDKYLEKEDNELEPRRQRDEEVEIFIDLGATQEDHDVTGNEKDITMQAGKQKGVLPLIRKFNEHSERLLKSALGEDGPTTKRRRIDDDASHLRDYYAQIDIEDLHDLQDTTGIILEMQDRQRYFEGGMKSAASEDASKHEIDIKVALREAKDNLHDWAGALSNLKLEKKAADASVVAMTQNVQARLTTKTRKNDIPEGLFRQMRTCQTAANEFLRQFWSSVYPPLSDLQSANPPTPAQKAAKAAKMAGYLAKTHEKVEALVRTAHAEGIDPERVRVAMKPLTDAVDQALTFHRTRKPVNAK
ncbi:hypothetical protein GLOTRDRAFT_115299 [Gloeophyllum trabeum ATCC 11539]|uniref:BSD domain-containing protein n=1 Tax=Gloeophyllum trabeum (strain ATCC 11539 / FP-39264 / Madison 617) TaxID=670483 RepID=S7QBI2_GLOTA|nr:uncharacterized protein GLOTRDRAFT_115299 [Gloeophyllum trabeum ATCC 11539]EPQ57316.1 hypothetical protein GLOTRDRAFT_115299 [Gloeophyllum trabeum ATCC 11539]